MVPAGLDTAPEAVLLQWLAGAWSLVTDELTGKAEMALGGIGDEKKARTQCAVRRSAREFLRSF